MEDKKAEADWWRVGEDALLVFKERLSVPGNALRPLCTMTLCQLAADVPRKT